MCEPWKLMCDVTAVTAGCNLAQCPAAKESSTGHFLLELIKSLRWLEEETETSSANFSTWYVSVYTLQPASSDISKLRNETIACGRNTSAPSPIGTCFLCCFCTWIAKIGARLEDKRTKVSLIFIRDAFSDRCIACTGSRVCKRSCFEGWVEAALLNEEEEVESDQYASVGQKPCRHWWAGSKEFYGQLNKRPLSLGVFLKIV